MSRDGTYEPAKTPQSKKCEFCGKTFTPKSWQYRNQRFHSKDCMYAWRKSKGDRIRTCKCGNIFEVMYPSNKKQFCNDHCIEALKHKGKQSKQRFIDNNPMHNPIHRRTQAIRTGSNTSKPEQQTIYELKSNDINFTPQFELESFRYDIYVPHVNTLIEVNGDYWHCNPKKYPNGPINDMQKRAIKNDKRKKKCAKDYGYKLLTIWEKEINDGMLLNILTKHIYNSKKELL